MPDSGIASGSPEKDFDSDPEYGQTQVQEFFDKIEALGYLPLNVALGDVEIPDEDTPNPASIPGIVAATEAAAAEEAAPAPKAEKASAKKEE